jgi:hypothetical protein
MRRHMPSPDNTPPLAVRAHMKRVRGIRPIGNGPIPGISLPHSISGRGDDNYHKNRTNLATNIVSSGKLRLLPPQHCRNLPQVCSQSLNRGKAMSPNCRKASTLSSTLSSVYAPKQPESASTPRCWPWGRTLHSDNPAVSWRSRYP